KKYCFGPPSSFACAIIFSRLVLSGSVSLFRSSMVGAVPTVSSTLLSAYRPWLIIAPSSWDFIGDFSAESYGVYNFQTVRTEPFDDFGASARRGTQYVGVAPRHRIEAN